MSALKPAVLSLALISGLLSGPSVAALFHYAAGDFDNWSTVTASGELNGQVSTPQASGGNPAGMINVTTVTRWATVNMHFDSGFVYDPAQGGIVSITASLDFRTVNTFGQGQGISPIALQQGGNFFIAGNVISGTQTNWTTLGPQVFGLNDFQQVGGIGGLLPDFSNTGALITVGFATNNSAGNTISVDYDNFSATLESDDMPASVVPLPGSAWLVLLGLVSVRATYKLRT